MIRSTFSAAALLLALTFASTGLLAQDQPAPDSAFTLYLIGDTGERSILTAPLRKALRRQLESTPGEGMIVFLGDNIYPRGMLALEHRHRLQMEEVLQEQVNWFKGLDVKGVFIPGNHDWQQGRIHGWQNISNQQVWLDSLKDEHVALLPRDGCPGPVEVPLNDKSVLVIIDSQWFLHPWDKPGEESDCSVKSLDDLVVAMSDIFLRHHDKRVIVAAHHPLITYGEHGGVFTWKDHIFPLTQLQDELYIPLPLVGSLYPFYRKLFGNIQDTSHPVYREYSRSLQKILDNYPGNMYVAGHEHALQYIVKDSVHHIVSGSGSKTSFVKKKKFSRYAASVTGFVKVTIQNDGSSSIEFWQADATYPEGKKMHAVELQAPARIEEDQKSFPNVSFAGRVKARASTQYLTSPSRKKLFGKNYRAEWAQELEVPVLDLGEEKGGLNILQKGGGMQTLSLRLADSAGHEYVLRSVEKYPEKAVPEILRQTFVQDLVQDQISASHPYGALVVPPLADAAGIYHTNPRLVYIPDDPRLGIYRADFANTLALFEERPDDDWSHEKSFGNSENIISTSKVLEKLQKDNDNEVDQEFVIRSRLFDMLIGDWDRHDDQWRWATFEKKKKGDLYRPIPRDRDHTFFVNEGWLTKVYGHKWAMPKFEGFDDDINWPSGLSFNARYFDRSFINEPDETDWIKQAGELQAALTDDVIEKAIREWPEAIFNLHGPEIIRKLKSRRDKLKQYAVSHYKYLAREVDVPGTDKHELFDVARLPGGDVHVKVYKINKEGERDRKIYDRLFHYRETNEIRLYGLGNEDQFVITGDARKSILVRIIGGSGNDMVADSSRVTGCPKKTVFYDNERNPAPQYRRELRDRRSSHPDINLYNRKAFKYNRVAPLLYGNYNPDDGVFIGGGVLAEIHGFRKDVFWQRHIGVASVAPRTNSYNFLYRGDFTNIAGLWNLEVNADIKSPNFVNNFFGWGNESVFDKDIDEQPGLNVNEPIDYYRFRFEEMKAEALLRYPVGAYGNFRIGPVFQRIEIEEPDGRDRFIDEYSASLPYDLYSEYSTFGGLRWDISVEKRDDKLFTRRGVIASLGGRAMSDLGGNATDFSSWDGSLAFYFSAGSRSRLVLAVRTGGGVNRGRYEFYQAQVLSGRTELRGFRKTRFYGDSKAYANFEARLKLINFRSYLFPASIGILAFHDVGRVWYENANGIDPSTANGSSNVWHKGWGGGVWFTPFNLTVVSAEAGHSKDGTLFYLRFGFLF